MASSDEGKRVLVTRGSSGIGRAMALELVQSGAHVAIAARGQERLDATLGELWAARRSSEQRVARIVMDVADREAVAEGVREAVAALGGLDVLVANQGYAETGYVETTDFALFEAMMRVNYFGHVALVQAALPHLRRSDDGAICLVASMLGFFGTVGYGAYAASKHAVAGFAKCLRAEVKPHGMRVTVAYVPTTDTPEPNQAGRHLGPRIDLGEVRCRVRRAVHPRCARSRPVRDHPGVLELGHQASLSLAAVVRGLVQRRHAGALPSARASGGP